MPCIYLYHSPDAYNTSELYIEYKRMKAQQMLRFLVIIVLVVPAQVNGWRGLKKGTAQ